jgi:3-hydroxyacyl-[acyl-carrier-protein] dehydratase
MVDRILSIEPGDPAGTPGFERPSSEARVGTRVTGLKNISWNEPWCEGHFPGFTLFPGVLVLEAMAQVASFSIYPEVRGDLAAFSRDFRLILVGVEESRFRKPVVPGDALVIQTRVIKQRSELWVFDAEASVEGQRVAEARIKANLSIRAGDGVRPESRKV